MKKICGIIKTLTLRELPALLQIVGYIEADYRAADWNKKKNNNN